jgi:hypothetical protein
VDKAKFKVPPNVEKHDVRGMGPPSAASPWESSLGGMAFSIDLDELRDAARGDPSKFAKLLQKLLATDFDLVFEYVKTQKLLHKQRSCSWIS